LLQPKSSYFDRNSKWPPGAPVEALIEYIKLIATICLLRRIPAE